MEPPASKQIYVYDTYTNSKVPLKTEKEGMIKWYTCGPTVYAASHVGHARNYMVGDTIRRILEKYFRYSIIYTMNITDIDDKIIDSTHNLILISKFKSENKELSKEVYLNAIRLYLEKKTLLKKGELQLLNRYPDTKTLISLLDATIKAEKAPEIITELETVTRSLTNPLDTDKQSDILIPYLETIYPNENVSKEAFLEYAEKWKSEFFKDMNALGVKNPDVVPCVSQHIESIVDCISKIINNGYAYASNGSVYFDSRKYIEQKGSIRKIGNWKSEILEDSTGERKFLNDFVLWKKSKSKEPSWESPWGPGRPGWHIECTAMALSILGETMDIHSGGIDLVFPHHNNEILQTEACLDSDKWVTHFMHAGHVHIKGHKMSKSLKNFISIKEALQIYDKNTLRLFFLRHKWNAPLPWGDEEIEAAKSILKTFKNFFESVGSIEPNKEATHGVKEEELMERIILANREIDGFFRDSFDTPSVTETLRELISMTNVYISESRIKNGYIINKVGDYVREILSILGIEFGNTETEKDSAMYIKEASIFRDKVRTIAKSKGTPKNLFEACDDMRKAFEGLGVRMEDGSGNTTLKKVL